jgi:opacity protein-like surface antigen
MKKLLAAVALATLIASPAFAQSFDPSVGSGNIAQKNSTSAPEASGQHGKTQRGDDAALFGRIGVE